MGTAITASILYDLVQCPKRVELDMFGNPVWDDVRRRSMEKARAMRDQGFFGAAMANTPELAYTGIVETVGTLDLEFMLREEAAAGPDQTNGDSPGGEPTAGTPLCVGRI